MIANDIRKIVNFSNDFVHKGLLVCAVGLMVYMEWTKVVKDAPKVEGVETNKTANSEVKPQQKSEAELESTVKPASEPAKSEEKLDTNQSGDQTIKVPGPKIENEWSPLKIEPVNSITKVPEQKSPIKPGAEKLEIITKIKIFNPHEGKRSKLEVPPTPAVEKPEKVSKIEGRTGFDENVGIVENVENVENFENVENVENLENLETVENLKNLKNVENLKNLKNVENTIPSPVKQLVEHYEKIEFNEISEIETSHSYFSPKQFFGYDNEDTHLISFDETPELINEGAQGSCVSKLNQTYDTHHERKICEKNLKNVKRKLSNVQSADPIVI